MKRFVFIGNRSQALRVLLKRNELYTAVSIWVLENSFLHQEMDSMGIGYKLFSEDASSKAMLLEELEKDNYDLLVANGCPFILPVTKLKYGNNRLFINTHPTVLPHLRGKTPLNGVIFLGYDFIGATTHYMDDGIDTGNIIAQKKITLTPDIDQGLIYYLSFLLEGNVFAEALSLLEQHHFNFEGEPQSGEGSYFNRETKVFSIDFDRDSDEDIIRKVRSVGITWQGIVIHYEGESYRLFEAEKIVNPFLLDLFQKAPPGSIVLKYSNKILIRTRNGLIKFSHVAKQS